MNSKKNLLIILPWLPYPLDSGGNQAVYNSIDAVKDYFNVFIVSLKTEENIEKRKGLLDRMNNIQIDLFDFSFKFKESGWYNIVKKVSKIFLLKIGKYDAIGNMENELFFNDDYIPQYKTILEEYIEKNNIDIVQTEFVKTLGLVAFLPEKVKKVFVHHEICYVRNNLTVMNTPYKDMVMPVLNKVKALELGYLNMYDAIITLSETDAVKLRKEHVGTPVYSSFAIVNNDKKYESPEKVEKKITFIGPECHYPNKNGLDWFLENVWNEVLKREPDMFFYIIGVWNKTTTDEYEHKYKNIKFLGFVENVQDVLKNSTMVVPILIGSGIRMKILEAAKSGVPFVTTSVGVEGLPFVNDEDCFIEDSPKLFAERIVELQDLEKQRKMTLNAYNKINSVFSLENLRENRLGIYKEIIKG